MWWLVVSVVLWSNIASQPVTDESSNSRLPRQLDYVECCPCPGSSRAGLQDLALESMFCADSCLVSSEKCTSASSDSFSRAAVLDDCPCRVRDADSQGSPSQSLPRAMRPVRPYITPDNQPDYMKPLLKPEVGLASSMLETLREVTDDEYQDALARDAARNAARVSELEDPQPETDQNVVTIVVSPIEEARDAVPEASNTEATRCLPDMRSKDADKLGQVRKTEKSSTFKLQPHRSLLDMGSAASGVKERVATLNKGLEGLRLKTSPSLLKLFPPKNAERGNIQSLLKLKNNKSPKEAGDVDRKSVSDLKTNIPTLKFPSLLNNNDGESQTGLGLRKPKLNIPKIRTAMARKPKLEVDDANPSPSIIQEQFSESNVSETTPIFGLKSLLSTPQTARIPLSLKNLLNLKDVELIPPKSPKISLPDLKLLPKLNVKKPSTSLVRTPSQKLTNNCAIAAKENAEQSNVNGNQIKHTQILDTLPHASENKPVFVTNAIHLNDLPNDQEDTSENEPIRTEILDVLPSASENSEIIAENIDTSSSTMVEETSNLISNLEPQSNGESMTEPVTKLSKDNIENIQQSDNSVEFMIENENENHQFQELEIIDENKRPLNEFQFSDNSSEGNQEVSIEIEDDGSNGESQIITLNEDGDEVIIEENPEMTEFESQPEEETILSENTASDEQLFSNTGSLNTFETQDAEVIIEEESPEINEFELQPEEETIFSENTASDEQLFSKGNAGSLNTFENQDAVGATSNGNLQIISTEVPEPELVEDASQVRDSTSSREHVLKLMPKDDVLSSIKERVTLKLKTLKNPDTKVLSFSRLIKSDKSAEDAKRNLFDENKSAVIKTPSESTDNDTDTESTEMKISETNQVNKSKLESQPLETRNTHGVNYFSLQEDTKNDTSNRDSYASSLREITSSKLASPEDFTDTQQSVTDFNYDNVRTSTQFGNSDIDAKDDSAKGCSCNLNLEKSVTGKEKSTLDLSENAEKEMESGASETVYKTASHFTSPKANPSSTPLLQQSIIVQPTPFLPTIPPLDLSNVNLPIFDDIRSRISGLLGGSTSSPNNQEESEVEFHSAEDCGNNNPTMSFDASTTSTRSAFPSLRPLEDINLDIFRLNPLAQGSSPLESTLPSLNLNSFKTRLALPKSLDLKPIKLQSALGGRDGGLFGATLTFGSDKDGSSLKAKPVSNVGFLGNPLGKIPSLEDLRSTMRANAQSLLSSPITKQISNPLEDTLKTTHAFGDSLRSHTENTIRNLQQSLSATMNQAQSNSRDKFARPENLLEMVSSAHEDMNDKLHAIHLDLQDRISSLHDRILDESKIPALRTPLLSGLGRYNENPSNILGGRMQQKKKSTGFRSSPTPKLIIKKKTSPARENKSVSKTKNQNKVKPYQMSKAASSLTPKSVEVPKLRVTSSKPPFLRPLQRDERVQLKEKIPIFTNEQRQKTKKNLFNPFGVQTKISIATTQRPVSFRTDSRTSKLGSKSISTKTEQTRLKTNSNVDDSRGFASELRASKVPPPMIQATTFESQENPSLEVSSFQSNSFSKEFKLGNPLRSKLPSPRPTESTKKWSFSKTTPGLLSLPKPTESPIVSKMREAIRIRLSHPVHNKEGVKKGVIGKSHGGDDIAKSASENKGIVVSPEPMKENVSYKCKMVCVRD